MPVGMFVWVCMVKTVCVCVCVCWGTVPSEWAPVCFCGCVDMCLCSVPRHVGACAGLQVGADTPVSGFCGQLGTVHLSLCAHVCRRECEILVCWLLSGCALWLLVCVCGGAYSVQPGVRPIPAATGLRVKCEPGR